jgi:hypothetical protein
MLEQLNGTGGMGGIWLVNLSEEIKLCWMANLGRDTPLWVSWWDMNATHQASMLNLCHVCITP